MTLGVAGYILPVMPGTIFMILAAYCFMHSSEKLYNKIVNHPIYGKPIKNYIENHFIPLRVKFIILGSMWMATLFTLYIAPSMRFPISLTFFDIPIVINIKIKITHSKNKNKNITRNSNSFIRISELSIDSNKYEVKLNEKKINLTFKELELLKLLASNPGRVFSRENLLKNIWDYDYYGGTRTVDVHVRRLRTKIEDHKYNFIETIWNVGYKFNENI